MEAGTLTARGDQKCKLHCHLKRERERERGVPWINNMQHPFPEDGEARQDSGWICCSATPLTHYRWPAQAAGPAGATHHKSLSCSEQRVVSATFPRCLWVPEAEWQKLILARKTKHNYCAFQWKQDIWYLIIIMDAIWHFISGVNTACEKKTSYLLRYSPRVVFPGDKAL